MTRPRLPARVAPLVAPAAVVAAGAAVRAAWMVYASRPVRRLGDPLTYTYYAYEIARGRGYRQLDGSPTAYYPVGFPGALGWFAWLLDRTPWDVAPDVAVSLFNFLPAVAVVACTFVIGGALFGRRAGLVAAAVVAAWPNLVFHSAVALTETLFLGLTTAAVAVIVARPWRDPGPAPARLVAFGALLGLSALVRPLTLPLLVVLPGTLRAAGIAWGRAVRAAGIAAAAAALVVAPWALRNTLSFDTPTFISTNMGDNLCFGRHEGASGTFALPPECTRFEAHEAEPEHDRENTARAIRYALGHPVDEIRLLFWRGVYTFEQDHDGLESTEGYRPAARGMRVLAAFADAYAWAMIGFALLSLVAWRHWREPRRLFVVLTGFVLAAPPFVFFGVPRFKLPAVPFLAVGAAVTLLRAGRGDGAGGGRPPGAPASSARSPA